MPKPLMKELFIVPNVMAMPRKVHDLVAAAEGSSGAIVHLRPTPGPIGKAWAADGEGAS